jgi:hypothetical protein
MPLLLSMMLALTPATPIEANQWFTSKKHSKPALAVARRGSLSYVIDVAPDGSAIRCTPAVADDLGGDVCEILMKSARFEPAKDAQGQPAFAAHYGIASFLMPGNKGRPDRSKLAVKVDALPAGATAPAYARISFLVDAAGVIGSCVTTPGEQRRFMQTTDALGPSACEHAAKDFHPAAVRNAAGEAVPSVQSIMVRFDTGAPSGG